MRGIKYVSEAADHGGYARAARGYLRELRRTGIPLTWTPMHPGPAWGMWLEPFKGASLPGDEFADLVNRPIDYDVVLVHLTPEYFPRWRAREAGRRMVGYTVWEFDVVPAHWPSALAVMDALVVPCEWNRRVFVTAGVTRPVAVVPHIGGGCSTMARPLVLDGVRPDDFVFYTISAWNERKAPHITLQSFLEAFDHEDPVVLLLKTWNVNERRRKPGFWWHRVLRHLATTRREIAALRKASGSSARVVVLTDPLTDAEIQALHGRGDCYVSLTRSEGWGLGAFEAAFAGKPVLITGHGGQLDYLPASLAYPVGYRLVTCGNGHGAPGARWAEPDREAAARRMQEIAASPADARRRGAALRAHVERQFAPADTIAILLRVLGGASA